MPDTSQYKLPQSWVQRLAIINDLQLTNDEIVSLFQVSLRELTLARGLVEQGAWTIPPLSDAERENATAYITDRVVRSVAKVIDDASVQRAPRIYSRRKPTSQGEHLREVFDQIPTNPIPLVGFMQKFGVSKSILRQSKRFARVPMKISIRKDPSTQEDTIQRVE